MLRKARIILSVVIFGLITFYFLDFAEILPNSFHRLAHIQFVPALMSLSFIILAVLILITLLLGRIYCSTICPMGIFQDIVTWISKKTAKKKKRFRYSPARNILRWGVLGVTAIAFLFGFTVILGLLDPYSAFGRMTVNVFKPVYMLGNNLLESIFSSFNNYTFYQVDASLLSISSFIIGLLTFLVIGFLAWKYGRTWCNTICPVGTLLGFLSRFSLFKVRIDTEKCNHCGLCATKCKASCINSPEQTIDYSRCVDCFDCLGECRQNALSYTTPLKTEVYRIEAADPYAENPYDDSDRIQNEAYNDLRPGVANLPDKEIIAQYDTIFVGSPCWWHQPAMVVCTFLEAYDLKDKVVIPFFTYGATTYLNESMQKIYKVTPESKHLPETLPEDLNPDDITTPGPPDDAGIDMPSSANGTEAWLRRIGIIK